MLRRGRIYDRISVLILGQAMLIALTSIVFWLQGGNEDFLSSLCGGMAAWIPAASFALIFARFDPGASPERQVRRFYGGEATKFLLTVVIFAVIFQWKDIRIIPLMVSYSLMFGAYWLALLR